MRKAIGKRDGQGWRKYNAHKRPPRKGWYDLNNAVERIDGRNRKLPITELTDFIVGIAASTSTNTAALEGTVEVLLDVPGMVYLIAPNVAASFDTQAEYDALVGDRVLLDLTSSTYTILASDGATNGCVIEPLDVAKYPGKVAFSFRRGTNYLA